MPQSKQIKQTLEIGYGTDPTSEQLILASEDVMLLHIGTRLKLSRSIFLIFRQTVYRGITQWHFITHNDTLI